MSKKRYIWWNFIWHSSNTANPYSISNLEASSFEEAVELFLKRKEDGRKYYLTNDDYADYLVEEHEFLDPKKMYQSSRRNMIETIRYIGIEY